MSRLLGIETSCDETAAAVVEGGRRALSNVVASQVEIHARYGGVVPEVASRQHLLSIIPTLEEALSRSQTGWSQLSGVAVTYGPGLAGSLIVGLNLAKAVAWAHDLPLVGVNHLEAHLYSPWLMDKEPDFPLVCLIVSGGHTDLVLMRGHGDYRLLGRSRDDAAGEAFDKGARILGLGYPGGPAIQRTSQGGDPHRYPLPRAWLKGSLDFSFSGVKTALLRLVEQGEVNLEVPASVSNAAASFQEAVVEVLVRKAIAAATRHRVRNLLLVGGVAANRRLREALVESSPLPVLIPSLEYCTDNAAMVAACGCFRLQRGDVAGWDLDAIPGLRLE